MYTSKEIADAFGWEQRGDNHLVRWPRSLKQVETESLVFLGRYMPEAVKRLNHLGTVTCVTTVELASELQCATIIHKHPRLAFSQILQRYFCPEFTAVIDSTASISPDAILGRDVSVGPGTVIEAGVRIGNGTRILSQVVITQHTQIGEHCLIRSNTTIGEPGFGFSKNGEGIPVRFPHIGRVCIGNYVEIGANCTVVRAALDETIIEDHVKTDDHVHIAHNCVIGARSQIAAGAVVSGSVTMGHDVWVGPNATISDYITIGHRARIALGAVVLRSVEEDITVLGNPAKVLHRKKSHS